MKLLLAADGSKFTKKALAFVVTHEGLAGPDGELMVLHVQTPVPPRVTTLAGATLVAAYHREEAEKVLEPVRRFLARHEIAFNCSWVVGSPVAEILKAVKKQKCQMIVMGTHGHGLLGRALMGSVAQRVVTDSEVPVLLVK
jgi:nucleotide-binding universal stress UspA family protein